MIVIDDPDGVLNAGRRFPCRFVNLPDLHYPIHKDTPKAQPDVMPLRGGSTRRFGPARSSEIQRHPGSSNAALKLEGRLKHPTDQQLRLIGLDTVDLRGTEGRITATPPAKADFL